eukprot:5933556-Alexandrium_andersonii.AAC.1
MRSSAGKVRSAKTLMLPSIICMKCPHRGVPPQPQHGAEQREEGPVEAHDGVVGAIQGLRVAAA